MSEAPGPGQSDSVHQPGVFEFSDHERLVGDDDRLAEMRTALQAGSVYIARGVVPRETLQPLRDYLSVVGRNSLPNYQPIVAGAPNSHRMNDWDPRAYVGGCFHQFSFFPWNQDPFRMFDLLRPVYEVKNRLSGLEAGRFLGVEPDAGCTARLSVQYYPRGGGGLKAHADPVDHHQLVVPSMSLCKKGEDFEYGGVFVEPTPGQRIMVEDILDWGDVIYFNAQCPHGIEPIDPDAQKDWLAFRGRWAIVFAVNKLSGNADISDSVELD
ncbi:MAG: hypothetical protein WBG86_01915 [Polyangiales bacterium]